MITTERPTVTAQLSAGQVEYRLERRGEGTVLIFHGGHVRAGLALGEEVFADLGYTVLAPSRPGYGRTPLATGTSAAGFADVVRHLCHQLDIDRLAAVVGISAGGRTAVTMAALYPEIVERLILESAVGFLPWPDRRTRLGANILFAGATEGVTWGLVNALVRLAPDVGLRVLMRDMSTEPVREVLAALTEEDRATLVALFSQMRSGQGFCNDLHQVADVTSEVGQPTLIIATRKDGAVPFAHAESLAAGIRNAKLVVSESDGHFIWFGVDYPSIASQIRSFLTH